MKRRAFLAATAATAAAPRVVADEEKKPRRVAVIGHTGRGNYGHGLDKVWLEVPGTEIVGVADADAKGLAKAVRRLNTDRGYRDYRRMLKDQQPEFATICPRHPDQHLEMGLACIEAGVKGIYIEKPLCRTPAEADELLAACAKHGTRIAVAHRNRYHPVLPIIQNLLEAGRVGRVLAIRGHGKGDRRGGGEDLWVLGTHVLNLFHYFGGDPVSCSAVLLQEGHPVGPLEVAPGAEGLGALAGDEVRVRYRMSDGFIATYDSIANDQTGGIGYGLQLVGSKGIIQLRIDRDPVAHLLEGSPFDPDRKPRAWVPITTAGVGVKEDQPEVIAAIKNHVIAVVDLIAAVDEGRDPLCDLEQGATTVEMVCAAFESHRQGGREVTFPLRERGNPLAHLEDPPE